MSFSSSSASVFVAPSPSSVRSKLRVVNPSPDESMSSIDAEEPIKKSLFDPVDIDVGASMINASNSWHPLFFDKNFKKTGAAPAKGLIVGGSFKHAQEGVGFSQLAMNLISLLSLICPEFPKLFTTVFVTELFSAISADGELLVKFGLSPSVMRGYIVARALKLVPGDYEEYESLTYHLTTLSNFTPDAKQALYLAYFCNKYVMVAFKSTVVKHLVNSKYHREGEIEAGIISTRWKLPFAGDHLLTIFISYPRELLQGADMADQESLVRAEFLESYLKASREFVSLHESFLSPFMRSANSRKHPMRRWFNIGRIVFATKTMDKYYSSEEKHPMQVFMKKLAKAFLEDDEVAQPQMFSAFQPRIHVDVPEALLQRVDDLGTKAAFAIDEATLAARSANMALQDANKVTARVNRVMDGLGISNETTADLLKGKLSEGVAQGVNGSSLGKLISSVSAGGKGIFEVISKILKSLGVLLPYVMTPIFVLSSYFVVSSKEWSTTHLWLAVLSGFYLLLNKAQMLISSGLMSTVMTVLSIFNRSGATAPEQEIVHQESFDALPTEVFTTMTMAFISLGFSGAKDGVSSFKGMCADVQKSARGFEAIVKAALTIVSSFADDVKGWLGIETKVSNPSIMSYVDDVTNIQALFKSGVTAPSFFLLNHCRSLYETGEVYVQKFTKEGQNALAAIVQRQLRTLEVVISDIRKVLSVPVVPRPQPVSIVIDGAPGTGKTILTRFLEKCCFEYELSKMEKSQADMLQKVYNERPLSLCYHKGQDFYWDAIAPSTMVVTMDDWLQRQTVKGSDYAPLMDFIGMANTEPWAPRMAFSKEEKWISPKYVFASTNATRFHDETIADPDAVYRRIDFYLTCTLDKSKIVEGEFNIDAYKLKVNEWVPNRSTEAQKGVAREVGTIGVRQLVVAITKLREKRALEASKMSTTMGDVMQHLMRDQMEILTADIFVDDPVVNQAGEIFADAADIVKTINGRRAASVSSEPAEKDLGDSVSGFLAEFHNRYPKWSRPVGNVREDDTRRSGFDLRRLGLVAPPELKVRLPVFSPEPKVQDCVMAALREDSHGHVQVGVPQFRGCSIESLDSVDLSSFADYRAEEIEFQASLAAQQTLFQNTGTYVPSAVLQESMDVTFEGKAVDAKKMLSFNKLSFTNIGLSIKTSWNEPEGALSQIREGFLNLCGGLLNAVLVLKEFLVNNAAAIMTVLGVVLTAVGLKALFKSDSEPENQSSSVFQNVKTLRVARRPNNVGPRTGATQQMGTDRFDAVKEKLKGNMYGLYGPDHEGKKGNYLGTVNGICDRIFHCPNHFLLKTKASWEVYGLPREHWNFRFVQNGKEYIVPYDSCVTLSDPEDSYVRDRVIFQVVMRKGMELPMCSNVLNHYVSDQEIGASVYRASNYFPVCLFNATQVVDEQKARFIHSRKIVTTYGSKDGALLQEDLDVRELFEYEIGTKGGDCGALLMATDSTTARIVGAHVAGSTRTGFSYRITSDEIKRVIYKKIQEGQVQPSEVPEYTVAFANTDPTIVSVHSGYDLGVHTYAVDYNIGSKSSTFTNSHLEKYLGNGEDYVEFDQAVTDTSPAAYAKARAPYCTRIDESEEKQKKFSTLLEACADAVADDLSKLKWKRSHRVYSYKEAVLGLPATNFKGVDFGTSAGYPWMNQGVKKTSLGTYVEGNFFVGSMYVPMFKKVEKLVIDLADDVIPEIVYQDTLKVEWRTIAKANVPRMVSSAPLDAVLAGRMLFGSFMHMMCDFCLSNETLIGFNPYGEATVFANQMLRFGNNKNFACADYKGFDTDHTTRMMMLAARIINKIVGGTLAEQRARTNYVWSIANSRHIRGSVMEVWPGSMPSGNVLTAILNCLINMINVRFIWLRANEWKTSCLPMFQDNVVFRCLGDDNAVAVSEGYRTFFTEAYQAETVALIGYRMTSATKDALLKTEMTNFEEVELLKRVPRWDVDRLRWTLPLRLSVVLYMPMKTKKDNYLGIASDNLETALQELSLHAPSVWDSWAPKMIKYGSNDFTPKSTSRMYYLDRVLEEGHFDPEFWV